MFHFGCTNNGSYAMVRPQVQAFYLCEGQTRYANTVESGSFVVSFRGISTGDSAYSRRIKMGTPVLGSSIRVFRYEPKTGVAHIFF